MHTRGGLIPLREIGKHRSGRNEMFATLFPIAALLIVFLAGCSSKSKEENSSSESRQDRQPPSAVDSKSPQQAAQEVAPIEVYPVPLATLRTTLEGGHTIFEGKVGDVKADIVFDTGMVEGILVSESVAKAAGLKRTRDFSFGGLGHGSDTMAYIAGPTSLVLGAITLQSEVIVVPEESTLGKSLCGLQAVMGYSLLEHYLVRVQPQNQRIELYEKDSTYSQKGEVLKLLFDEKDRKISIPIALTLSGRTETRTMTIDTGNSGHPILFENAPPELETVPEGSFGASGFSSSSLGRIGSLSIGREVFHSPIIQFDGSGQDGSGQHNLSNEFMRQFEAVYDLATHKLILRKTAKVPPAKTEVGNGLVWDNAGCGQVKKVAMVLSDSVGEEVGLRSGDTLVQIDGDLDLGNSFRHQLEREQPVSAQFQRGKKRFRVKLYGEDRMLKTKRRSPPL